MVDKRPSEAAGWTPSSTWLEQRTTTPDGVYRVLRAAILDGTVPAGGQLREAHIAADLGISRSPLREALTRLEEEGLVVKIPFRGAFVVEVSARGRRRYRLDPRYSSSRTPPSSLPKRCAVPSGRG